jgi:hypothetical protein
VLSAIGLTVGIAFLSLAFAAALAPREVAMA